MSIRARKIITFLLILTVVSFAIVGLMVYDAATKVIAAPDIDRSKTIYELESDLKDLEAEEQKLRDQVASDTANLSVYTQKLADLEVEIQILADRLVIIESLGTQWQAQSDSIQTQIDDAKIRQAEEIEAFEEMLRMSYKYGDNTYFDIIFGSQDMLDFLSRVDMISYHAQAENNILNSLATTITSLETLESQYTASQEALASYGTAQELLGADLELKRSEAETMKTEYQNSLDINTQLLSDKETELDAMEAEIKRRYEEERANNVNQQYIGGAFVHPCPTRRRISSEFEVRVSPISGKIESHNGIDMAANAGEPIYAAASGTVIDSRYSSSWGNVVQIDHGGGIVTLYAHCTTRLVTKGQVVSAGEQIATVGTTGWSTGNHLHFTVYKNGVAVNPREYLPSNP
ncbi:MAG: hypothetical protein E7600_07740 [Ruminococcaceae bacterium]|nr:hypothetical protein [Oscillospiraceae bacterium]